MGIYQTEKPDIVARLIQRLDLEAVTPISPLLMAGYIQPVVDIAQALTTPKIGGATLDLTGIAGTPVVAFTVPTGKRWTPTVFWKAATNANTRVGASDGATAIALTGVATAEAWVTDPLIMLEGWYIYMEATGNVGDGAIPCALHYLEEDAF